MYVVASYCKLSTKQLFDPQVKHKVDNTPMNNNSQLQLRLG